MCHRSIQVFATYLDGKSKSCHRCQLMSLVQGNTETKRGQITAAWIVGYRVAEELGYAKQFDNLKSEKRSNRKPHTSLGTREMRNRLMTAYLVDREVNEKWPCSCSSQASRALCSKDHRAFCQYLDQLAYVAYAETC